METVLTVTAFGFAESDEQIREKVLSELSRLFPGKWFIVEITRQEPADIQDDNIESNTVYGDHLAKSQWFDR